MKYVYFDLKVIVYLCMENEEGCVTKCKVVIISLIVVLLACLFCFLCIYISLV